LVKLLALTAHREEVPVEEGVEVKVEGNTVAVKGPLGELVKDFSKHHVEVKLEDGKVVVESKLKGRRGKALAGTIAAHIRNMIRGVKQGYTYRLKIVYSHFPISVKVEGDKVVIENFRGEKQKRIAKVLGGAEVKVEGDDIIVRGVDLDAVSQTAANIELATKSRGYDPRVFLDGIYVYRKEVGMQ